jgi:hypothetical protein
MFWFFHAAAQAQPKFFENGQPTRLGADVGMFPDSPSRKKVDLSGSWRYTTDQTTWNAVTVPSCYDSPAKVTFMRTFEITGEMLDRYTFALVAYGINYQSEVMINGNFVGRHMGGHTSFVFPIAQNILQVGRENAIVISVDNALTPKTTLPLRQMVGGWRTYGGIFRDIFLLATPRFFVEKADVSTTISADGKSGNIVIKADLLDRGSDVKVEQGSLLGFQVDVIEKLTGAPAGRSGITPLIPQPNKSIQASAQVAILAPKIWSPELPDLYTAKCQIVRVVNKETTILDEYSMDVGIRDIAWKDGKLLVGGVPTHLKGVLWIEDHVGFGSAMTYEALEKDIASIKAVGANVIRFPAPPHPYVINLCDRYGIFVMEEVPFRSVPTQVLNDEYFQDIAFSNLKEMLMRDKHHVSLIAWGIGEEFASNTDAACEYVNAARNMVKALDSRPVYFAGTSPESPCLEFVDLVAVNSYGDDLKAFRELLRKSKAAAGDRPVILTRYGKNIEPGNRNGYSDPRSLEAQGRYLMLWYDAIKESKIAGSILFSFNDWRTDRPALTTHAKDPFLQSSGLVGYDREKRISYEVARAMFNGEKAQALPIGSYSQGAPIVYVFAGLVVLIGFAFMYNANRRFRDCVNRSILRTYNFFADVRDQRILAYSHSTFLAIVVAVTWATILSSVLTHYRESLLLDNILSQVMSDEIKEWLVRLIWNPAEFILVMSGIILVKLVLAVFLVKIFSMFVRTHVYFYHAFSVVMWSLLPYIILIPISMILYRLMDSEVYILPLCIVMGVVTLWVIGRLFKGISIIYDVYPGKIYVGGILFLALCAVVLYGYIDYTQSATMYLKFLLQQSRSIL